MKKRKRKQRMKEWVKNILSAAAVLILLMILIVDWLENGYKITALDSVLMILGVWWAAVEWKRVDRK